jgi:replicative DNA helicase
MVMFLSRPEMYGIKNFEDGSSTKDIAELVIGKQRNGPIGTIRLLFLKNYGRFQSTANSYLTAAENGQHEPEPQKNGGGYLEASLPEPPPRDMDSFINSDAAPF